MREEPASSVVTSTRHPPVRVRNNSCDACGSTTARVLHSQVRDYDLDWPDAYDVVECVRCGLAYLSPQPVPEDLPVYYPATYSCYNPREITGVVAAVQRFLEWRKAQEIGRLIGRRGRILDAGCSYGGFLQQLARVGAWELFGIDPDPASIRYAREVLGLRAEALPFAALPEDTLYDCIIFKHTFDHLPSATAAFGKLQRIVRPGGYLILNLPNRRSFEARLFGRYWDGWEVPRQYIYFTARDVARYAARFGFQFIRARQELRPNSWIWSLRYAALDVAPALARFCNLRNVALVLVALPLAVLSTLAGQSGRVEYLLRKRA